MLDAGPLEPELAVYALRSREFSGRSADDTDVVTTTIPTLLMTNGRHVARFLQGITALESMNALIDALEAHEGAYVDSGLLTNHGNRHVRE